MPEPEPSGIVPESIALDIVYEDDDIIVINKPKGMVVHPAAGNRGGTLANALMHHCGESLSGINGRVRPGIVHRLDKDTSGLLVAAKNDAAHLNLSGQIRERTTERIYRAIVCGVIKQDSGVINKPVGRHEKDRKKMSVNVKNGREAITFFTVIERFKKNTLIEARLHTGRTHQIRVHMASIGFPVYGDAVYGQNNPKTAGGQALHAKTLAFDHPATHERLCFDTPLPDYFIEILEGLR